MNARELTDAVREHATAAVMRPSLFDFVPPLSLPPTPPPCGVVRTFGGWAVVDQRRRLRSRVYRTRYGAETARKAGPRWLPVDVSPHYHTVVVLSDEMQAEVRRHTPAQLKRLVRRIHRKMRRVAFPPVRRWWGW